MLVNVLDVFERHGLHHRDDQHTGCAIGLVMDAALIYDARAPRWTAVVGTVLAEEQTQLLGEMCRDALSRVTAGLETCGDCDQPHGDLCPRHVSALMRANAYRSLSRYLGAQVT